MGQNFVLCDVVEVETENIAAMPNGFKCDPSGPGETLESSHVIKEHQ